MADPIRIVSVSLGSSRRDKTVETEFLGRPVVVQRLGTDGDMQKAAQMIEDLDGKVAAIGLGGIDLYLIAGKRRWIIRDAARLAAHAKTTPVVDGSGLKNTLERETVNYLAREGHFNLPATAGRKPRVLLVSAVDRFGMAEAVDKLDVEQVFGDLIFALKIPIPVRTLGGISLMARTLLPILTRLPFQMLYPTGEKQHELTGRGNKWFNWADVIAGDFLFIGPNLPRPDESNADLLAGKMIVTNTTTEEDVAKLKALGLQKLVTTTPRLQGRSPGTNVMEGVLVALSGKRPEQLTEADYLDLLRQLQWEPTVELLQAP
jgi:hypothetical protein